MSADLTDLLLGLVPLYGAWALFAITLLSCLALPVPSSLAMLAGGAFAAVGDLSLGAICAAAFAGAVLGDQAGYGLGRVGGPWLARLRPRASVRKMQADAAARLARRGWMTVFLTRWLISPLGPYVNLAAGVSGLAWWRFTTASALGEAVWVALYVGLGWAFAAQIDRIASLTGAASGAIAAAVLAGLGGHALWRMSQHKRGRAAPLPLVQQGRKRP